MLKNWLHKNTITVCEEVENWQDAILLSAKPLLESNAITQQYISAIFQNYEKLGPYFVLAPNIAMPHARPEEGVNQQALSLLLVKNGVIFHSEDNDPVYLIILLSATDSHSHLAMIAKLMSLLIDDDAIERIIAATSADEIETIISSR